MLKLTTLFYCRSRSNLTTKIFFYKILVFIFPDYPKSMIKSLFRKSPGMVINFLDLVDAFLEKSAKNGASLPTVFKKDTQVKT
ncbi:MAG TPA: hypothetical protein DEB70_00815 [Planctomycetaceae bacterium]|nr:hypothetical protein [Planctomycetaceae bacterium]|tara:strand:- start:174 stop:422 length:249 start_codon:yes stop_codon:yes gene_type:complete